ncbi:MAG TPA: hypothetical protein VKV77_13360 [Methylovirgula sp.]|nr:hypothetical protein [Methylovirgula sp.]
MAFRAEETGSERACGACSLCCKLLPIAELDKPHDRWCVHCRPGNGCTIYDSRPTPCRNFACNWLADRAAGEHWYPLKSRMVVQITPVGDHNYDLFVDVHVDSGAPNAWRAEPYHSELRQMSASPRTLVRIFYGSRIWFMLPDGEVEVKKQAGSGNG